MPLADLHLELLASQLLAGKEAAEALAAGWQAERLAPASVIDELFVVTYRLRAAHVGKFSEAHWQQLAASTEEFVRNIEPQVGSALECISLKGGHEHEFVIFRAPELGRVLGCMRVIPARDTQPPP